MIQEVKEVDKDRFNLLATHPLQSWEWGEFREKTGVGVIRLGWYRDDNLEETAQVTLHPIPRLPWKVGYWPKGGIPSEEMVSAVEKEVRKKGGILVTMEPNVLKGQGMPRIEELREKYVVYGGRPLFTRWSFWLDLTKTEEELMAGMKSKTRYNVRYAERRGVKVVEDNSKESFEQYWKLTEETTNRQKFYAHNREYHRLMFETLSKSGMARLFRAEYKGKTLVAWVVFILNGVIYYPYGASTREFREVYPSDAMMWEVIKWGKSQGAKIFDMWGSPGPNPKPSDSWYGFHRFKLGFGAELVEFVGTYDLVIDKWLYPPYRALNEARWVYLRARKR